MKSLRRRFDIRCERTARGAAGAMLLVVLVIALLTPVWAQTPSPKPAPSAGPGYDTPTGTTPSQEPAKPEAPAVPDSVVWKPGPPPTPEEITQARALLERAVRETFIGKPSDLKAFSWSDSGKSQIVGREFPVRTQNVLAPPRCYWSKQLLPMGVQTIGFCDGVGWLRDIRGAIRDLNGKENAYMIREREMDLLRILNQASVIEGKPLPDTVLAAGPASGVSVSSDVVKDFRIWMDKQTGRIVRTDCLDNKLTGPGLCRHIWDYHDYQPVGDMIRWPTLRTKSVNGEPFIQLNLQKAECNPKMESTFFDKPKE